MQQDYRRLLLYLAMTWIAYKWNQPGAVVSFAGKPRVVDGDSLKLLKKRVRLFGVDSPESAQTCKDDAGESYACGQRSTDALRGMIGQASVRCDQRDVDQYNRVVAVCWLQGGEGSTEVDLNQWMVRNGHAVAYRSFSSDYEKAEMMAQEEGKGIWQGSFEEPSAFRKRTKLL